MTLVYRTRAIVTLGLSVVALAGCGQRETQVDVAPTEVADTVDVCKDPLSAPLVLEVWHNADTALRHALEKGTANPAEEAEQAVAAGDYRLAATLGSGGVSTQDFGAECRAGYPLDQRMTRVLAYHDADDKLEGYAPGGKISAFGKAYNDAVLDNPKYPYRDICRSVRAGQATDSNAANQAQSGFEKAQYGFGYLARTSGALTPGQAARRGSITDLGRIMRRNKQALDQPDLFGLTPLAWAIAFRQRDAAVWLLNHGANPGGPACHTILDHVSPMQVARAIHWRWMVTHMRPMVSPEDFNDLREAPRVGDADIAAFNHGLTVLNDKYRKTFDKNYLTRHHLILALDETGKPLSCRFEPATISPEYDKDICALGMNVLHWQPARSAYGTDIPEDASLLVGVRGN